MGLFNKESYEDKCKRKEEERIKRAERDAEQRKRREQFQKDEEMAQLGAFMEYYQLTDMNESDLIVLQRITNAMAGNKIGHIGEILKGECDVKTVYLSAIVEQNFMMIKQLSELNSKLDKIINKDKEKIDVTID